MRGIGLRAKNASRSRITPMHKPFLLTCLSQIARLPSRPFLRWTCAGETGGDPAPKEQPPRKLSGKRTAYVLVSGEQGDTPHRRS